MPGAFHEFKNFMLRGHIITYIIGVSVGASYAMVVSAIVKHLLMPLIYHYLLNDENAMAKRKLILCEQKCEENGKRIVHDEIAIGYGSIIEALINFFLISSSVYVVLRVIGHLSKRNLLSEDSHPKAETRSEAALAKIVALLELQQQSSK
jgi:large conductance mechanosensitive channel